MITHNGQTYKIVITTPAGRERYLDIIKKYVYRDMAKGLIDGWQIWQNTVKQSDIDYFKTMEAENPKVKVFRLDVPIEDKYNYCDTFRTCEFFKYSHDDDTIYIRLDDDIVWYEDEAITKIAIARIEHPEAYIIYPNIINSTITCRMYQDSGVLGQEAGLVNGEYLDEFTYTDSKLIDLIHETFKKHYEEGNFTKFYLPSQTFDTYRHFSICSVSYWGKDKLNPSSHEEPSIAWEMPAELKRPNYFLGDCLMVHYSYHTQRDYLESCKPEKLEFYKTLADNIKINA